MFHCFDLLYTKDKYRNIKIGSRANPKKTSKSSPGNFRKRTNYLIATIGILFILCSNLFAKAALTDIYFKDYELINRTVLKTSAPADFHIEQLPEQRKIRVTLKDTERGATVPLLQQTTLSSVLESIATDDNAADETVVTLKTAMPYYLEYFSLDDEDYRVVLDIYSKRHPETKEEKLIFSDFYSAVGYNDRANKLIGKIDEINNNKPNRVPANVDSRIDLISLSKSLPFPDAVRIFDSLFRQKEDKRLLNMTDITEPIGFDIEKIHWKSALASILHQKRVDLEEREDIVILREKDVPKPDEEIVYRDNVLIEATFFEADFSAVKELGIDWSTVIDGRVRVDADLRTAGLVTEDIFRVRADERFERGGTTVDINTLFRAFSASDKGHIISRPQITVISGETGSVQEGVDYTILVPGRTAVGEEVARAHEVQVQSGTIVHVTPTVITDKEGEKAIDMEIRVERSSAVPDVTGYTKTLAEVLSNKILYNGEETVIGGLITRERVNVRKGIPFLKDLPWWVFGIRYLTGYERSRLANKELIILIKATILPTVEERRRIGRDVSEDIDYQRRRIEEVGPKLID